MCTSISLPARKLYGRNLDLEVSFGEAVVVTPRTLPLPLHGRPALARHYALLGMATVADGLPLYAEAVNEKGLYMAGLNFPGNAHYLPETPDAPGTAPFELIWRVLGECADLAEARALLEQTRVVAVPFGPGWPLAPLHWHIADATGSLAAEPTTDGLRLYEDAAGVLTNNPPFPFHTMNLPNYMGLGPRQPDNRFSPALDLRCYGQGMGALGLPGDASPASRYVRAAFLAANADFGGERDEQVLQFFHLLDAVAMVRGSVITPEGKPDETIYSCCIDAAEQVYYYKTRTGSRVCAVRLRPQDLEADGLRVIQPERRACFAFADGNG